MCQVIFTTWEGKNGMWIYFGIAVFSWPGSYPVTTMQQMMCPGKGDAGFRYNPAYSYFCNTPRCLNRNVFCKPQDPLLIILLHIYLPVSETLKYNMDSNLPGFLWCLMKSITWFLVFFEHVFHLFSERILDMVICITSEK